MTISPLTQFANDLSLFPMPIISIGIPKLSLYTIIITLITLGFYTISTRTTAPVIGNRWSVTVEALYSTISSILRDQIGERFAIYLPMAITLFSFLLFANLFSNIPYSYGITTSVVVCLGLSVIVFIGVTILGITIHRTHWLSFFVPSGSPLALVPLLVVIEAISFVARAFSLGIRLFANLVAGHVLIAVISSMVWVVLTSGILYAILGTVPFAIFVGLYILELAVSVIQAYVFTLLFCSYLNDAINLH